MKEVGLEQVNALIANALAEENLQVMASILWPALDQFPDNAQLYMWAAHLCTRQGYHALALLCAQKANDLEPNGANYTNIGSILRRLNLPKESVAALQEAVGYEPDNPHPWNNLAASYVNEGNPGPGLEAGAKALELNPDFDKARWNLGLLQLEAGDFKNGFDNYRAGLVVGERLLKNYTGDPVTDREPKFLVDIEELREFPDKHGRKPRIIVWGEQGMGDEIMFSTILPDLAKDAIILLDCHPRMEQLMRDAWMFFDTDVVEGVYPTRKQKDAPWYADVPTCDFKCSIGDLARWYRSDNASFNEAILDYGGCFLEADPDLVQMYRGTLEELRGDSDLPLVGFGWTGGIINTQRWYRSAQLEELGPLMQNVQPVSLQYEDDMAAVQDWYEKTGQLVFRFPGITDHYDYHHTLALVMALDAVVTVCQSVAHLSAAAGQKTFVLVPDKPAWRYGLEGSDWYWYGPNATLYRRPGASWAPAVQNLKRDLDAYLK